MCMRMRVLCIVYCSFLFCSAPLRSVLCASLNYVYAFLCMDGTLYAHYLYAYSSIQIFNPFLFCLPLSLSVCVHSFLKRQWSQLWIFSISVRVSLSLWVCVHLSILHCSFWDCSLYYSCCWLLSCGMAYIVSAFSTSWAFFASLFEQQSMHKCLHTLRSVQIYIHVYTIHITHNNSHAHTFAHSAYIYNEIYMSVFQQFNFIFDLANIP